MAEETIINMPNTPEEFGIALDPAELRRLDFSALDFSTLRRAGIEYIRTYYPDDFNDFFANNGIMMLLELVSYVGNNISQRGDILIDEAFLSTAQTKQAVIQHLSLINQKMRRATPATVDVEITVRSESPTDIRIPAGTTFTSRGPDGFPVYYEIFRAPGDFTSSIIIPPGKKGVIAHGIEGQTATPVVRLSSGGKDQIIELDSENVLDEPITVEVATDSISTQWRRVDIIEKSEANDEVFEVRHQDDSTLIVFGNDVAGKSPLAGQQITVNYRAGGGIRGRIDAGSINETRPVTPEPPASAAVEALFRNVQPSSGGTNAESLEQAKRRAPREFATQGNAVTGEDYGLLAQDFSHPVFGSVAKAIGVLRTGVDQDVDAVVRQIRAATSEDDAANILKTNFINRNIVELYVLANGPGNTPVTPNSGLKQGLVTYFEQINVLTDELRVFDGAVKPVDVEATVVVSRNADAGTVKVAVQNAINNFFNIRNFDMGTPLYLSNLYPTIQDVPGVKYVDIFKPADDIIQTYKIADATADGVGFNEIVTLGEVNLKFYFEPANYRVPPSGRSS
jgi:hypothetical protein